MIYSYPINLQITNKECLVVGGGKVAERKVKTLLYSGGNITIVSPKITQELARIILESNVIYYKRGFCSEDLENKFIVIAATNNSKINSQITSQAQEKNILVNNIDSPEEGNFTLPATLQQGPLQISVSTNGCSPALARKIKEDLTKQFGEEYKEYLFLLKELREFCLTHFQDQRTRQLIFEKIIDSDLIQLIKEDKIELVEERVKKCLSLQ